MPKAGWIFLRQRERAAKGRHCYDAAHEVSLEMAAYFRRLGISASAHMLRHWLGTSVYASSRDLRVTQELMGHSSPVTTAVYTVVPGGSGGRDRAPRGWAPRGGGRLEEFRGPGLSTVTGRKAPYIA